MRLLKYMYIIDTPSKLKKKNQTPENSIYSDYVVLSLKNKETCHAVLTAGRQDAGNSMSGWRRCAWLKQSLWEVTGLVCVLSLFLLGSVALC